MGQQRQPSPRRRPRPPPTRFDPFADDPHLRQVYQALHAGEWDDLVDLVQRDAEPWFTQSLLTSTDAAVETVVFERWHDEMPSAWTLSMVGGAHVRDAWELLDQIDPETDDVTFETIDAEFQDRLIDAEEILHEAVRSGPALADPWVYLLSSGRGLGRELAELRTRFENAHSRMPFRPDACREYVFGLSSRGGGTDAAMFDFARWVQVEAKPGSAARVALPMAHLEYGLGVTSELSLTEHLSMADTIDELAPALAAFLRSTPPDAGAVQLEVLNTFGLAMTVNAPDTARLVKECFRRIDNRPTSYPWSLYTDESITDVFNEVHRSQLRAVARFEG